MLPKKPLGVGTSLCDGLLKQERHGIAKPVFAEFGRQHGKWFFCALPPGTGLQGRTGKSTKAFAPAVFTFSNLTL